MDIEYGMMSVVLPQVIKISFSIWLTYQLNLF